MKFDNVEEIKTYLSYYFNSEDKAEKWFNTKHYAFDNITPMEYINKGYLDEVVIWIIKTVSDEPW